MSSRNGYLTTEQRQVAPLLYQTLCQAKQSILLGAELALVKQHAIDSLQNSGFQVDYFNICRANDLTIAKTGDTDLVILTAAKLGKTRLIDNLCFTKTTS
jgi:pantoate--beta-alanine ligase